MAPETCEERAPLTTTSKDNHISALQQGADSSECDPSSRMDVLQHEASLLMGLRTGESASKKKPRNSTIVGVALPVNNHHHAFPVLKETKTILNFSPQLKDPPDLAFASSTDTTDTYGTFATAESGDSKTLPKTCFPVPYPQNYPKRLTTANDHAKLNALHCFLRSELLEIFVVEKSNEDIKFRHAPSSSVGRVGLRCVHCAIQRNRSMEDCPEDEAPMSVFFPKAIHEIYRLVTSWQRCHLRKCRNLPPTVRRRWDELRKSDKSRGKTAYWIESAQAMGLRDCSSRAGGMRFEVSVVEAGNAAAGAGTKGASLVVKQEKRDFRSECVPTTVA